MKKNTNNANPRFDLLLLSSRLYRYMIYWDTRPWLHSDNTPCSARPTALRPASLRKPAAVNFRTLASDGADATRRAFAPFFPPASRASRASRNDPFRRSERCGAAF